MSDWLSGGGEASLKRFVLTESYSRISWVYACVNIIAETIGGTPVKFSRANENNSSDVELIENPDDPVNVLFNPPNKPSIPSLRDLNFRTFVHLGIEGGLFWVFGDKSQDGQWTTVDTKRIGQLKPVFSDDEKRELLGWVEVNRQTQQLGKAYTRDEVLAIFYYNPRDPLAPLSPLSAARLALESEFYMNAWNSAFFKQGLRSPLAITTKAKLTTKQEKEWNRKVKQFYSGMDEAHTALLLSGGAEAKELALSTKDLDFVNGKKLNREEICAVYGVPPAMVGIFEFANYANSEQQRKIFWQNTVIPRLNMVEELIQVNVLDTVFPGVVMEFDLSDIEALQRDPADTATAAKTYFDMGYNRLEIANILDMPELAEEIDDPNEEDGEPPPDDESDDDEPPPDDGSDDDTPVVITPESVGAGEFELKEINPSQWQRYGESHFAMMRNEERKLDKVVRIWFDNAANAYAKQVRRTNGREAYQDPGVWGDLWRGTVNIQIEALFDLGGQIAAVELAQGAGGPLLPEVRMAKAVNLSDYMTDDELRTFRDATGAFINKIVMLGANEVSAINAMIPELIEQGGTVAQIADRIRDFIIDERYTGQATTIARTTANAAYNNARATFFEIKGVTRHKWVNAGDAHVRDTHQQEGGNETALGEPFPVTRLLYPHDPAGSAAEVINCRCTTIATARGNREQPTQVRTQPDSASAQAQAAQSIQGALSTIWATVKSQSRAVRQPRINSRGQAISHSTRHVARDKSTKFADDLLTDDQFTQMQKALDVYGPMAFDDVIELVEDAIPAGRAQPVKLTTVGKQNLSEYLTGHIPPRIREQLPPAKIRRLRGTTRAQYDLPTRAIEIDDQRLADLYDFMNNPEAFMQASPFSSRRAIEALKVVAHEHGHHIDFHVAEIRAFSQRFFRSRTVERGELIAFDRFFGKADAPEWVYEDKVSNTYQLRVYPQELPPGTTASQVAEVANGIEVFAMFNEVIALLPNKDRIARALRDAPGSRAPYGDIIARPLMLDQDGFREALQFLYGDF